MYVRRFFYFAEVWKNNRYNANDSNLQVLVAMFFFFHLCNLQLLSVKCATKMNDDDGRGDFRLPWLQVAAITRCPTENEMRPVHWCSN